MRSERYLIYGCFALTALAYVGAFAHAYGDSHANVARHLPAQGQQVGAVSGRLPDAGFGADAQAEPGDGAVCQSRIAGQMVAKDRRLLNAIRWVESRGNHRAVGDQGRSRGAYQIQAGYWNPAVCERVMAAAWAKAGCRTQEEKARFYNGGKGGMHSRATLAYWHKVQQAMDRS